MSYGLHGDSRALTGDGSDGTTVAEPGAENPSNTDERITELEHERAAYLARLDEVNVARQANEVRAIEAEARIRELTEQRDALARMLASLADGVELAAAERATAADMGASEWEAFVPNHLWEMLKVSRAVLGGVGEGEPNG